MRESSGVPERVSRTTAPITDADQLYYWTHWWQQDEREALEDIAAGRVSVFHDPADAVRYLMSATTPTERGTTER